MQRVSRSLSLSEQWFTLWDILFPGLPRPESAFVQGPVAEVCSEVVRWWDRYGRTVVAEHIEANGGSDEFERRVRNYESDLTALFVTVGRGLLVGVIGQMRSGSPDEERAVTTQTTTRSLYPSDSVGALRTSPESDRETQRTAPSTPATGDEADQNEPAPASKPGATAEVEHEVRPENEKLPPGENEMMSSRTQPSLDDINAWAEYAHDSRMVAADSFEWWNDVGGESYGMPTWM
ncbi:hypothetical protein Micbo1qcDRAFT_161587 [Microdochium bolleyi]|uniref:Uncharacterized protein n=1 Tax=Microdochium bolleyi TaxID=196109 RepID=A0A136J8U6_9PEZI|nr:hypothetical protein Micbo1qcDRAFT_161587 [Microdochium bolleyi]